MQVGLSDRGHAAEGRGSGRGAIAFNADRFVVSHCAWDASEGLWSGEARLERRVSPRHQAQVCLASDARGRIRPVAVLPAGLRPPFGSQGLRAVCDARGAGPLVIACLNPGAERVWMRADGIALDLTGLEMRITEGLVLTGDLRRAARCAGVGYETARSVVKSALAKAGVRRQAELVALWVSLQACGAVLEDPVDALLVALFDLTPRQARIADLVGSGLERGEAAWRLGVSTHVVKAELKAVFDACRVHTQTALAALTAEIRVLDAVVRAQGERAPGLMAA